MSHNELISGVNERQKLLQISMREVDSQQIPVMADSYVGSPFGHKLAVWMRLVENA